MTWIYQPLVINEKGLFINGASIVETWESSIQAELAKMICVAPNPVILEIGYGLGLASKEISKFHPSYHLVIEGHSEIGKMAKETSSSTNVLIGLWENNIDCLQTAFFDGILFDAYPMENLQFDGSAQSTFNQVKPFIKKAHRVLKKMGILAFLDFSCEITSLDNFKNFIFSFFSSFEEIKIAINPPADCYYAQHKFGNIILVKK